MEIERKFLISKENLPANLDAYPHHKLEQGYLSTALYPLIYEPFFILCDIKIHLDIPFPVRHALPPFFIRV